MHYFSGKGCSESLESMHYCIGILTKSITVIIYLVFFLFLLDSVTFCDIGADPVPFRRNYVRLWLLYVESAVSS